MDNDQAFAKWDEFSAEALREAMKQTLAALYSIRDHFECKPVPADVNKMIECVMKLLSERNMEPVLLLGDAEYTYSAEGLVRKLRKRTVSVYADR